MAEDYLKELIGSGTRPPGKKKERHPTLYRMKLLLSPGAILDTRRPEDRDLFTQLARESRRRFGDDGFSKNELMVVPRAPGSILSGTFPSFGIARVLLELLVERGMQAAIVGEGSQGASLIVSHPAVHVQLVERIAWK